MTVVFASDRDGFFATLQSNLHLAWVLQYASTLKEDARYIPTDCFETFPLPIISSALDSIGERYHDFRRQIMLDRQEGLTATYNRFHDPDESAADIAELRRLHVEMDHAVTAAYGWDDLDLGHGFHETRQGVRHTISEPARREVLTRLLALNHARYAEEVAAGLHDKKSAKGKGKKRRERSESEAAPSDGDELPEQQELFDDGSPKQRRLL